MPGQLRELSADECLNRLRHRSFLGRLAFVVDGRPIVLPVNYIADMTSITFCTERGTKLSALSSGATVAFEIDESRPLYHSGWSVVVSGTAREITDRDKQSALAHGPLKSWAVHPTAHWMRITIESISGRALDDD